MGHTVGKNAAKFITSACSDDSTREHMSRPCVIDSEKLGGRFLCATDGHRLHMVQVGNAVPLGYAVLGKDGSLTPIVSDLKFPPIDAVIPDAFTDTFVTSADRLRDLTNTKSKHGTVQVRLHGGNAAPIIAWARDSSDGGKVAIEARYAHDALLMGSSLARIAHNEGLDPVMISEKETGWYAIIMPMRF
jgi:hypothetical protein